MIGKSRPGRAVCFAEVKKTKQAKPMQEGQVMQLLLLRISFHPGGMKVLAMQQRPSGLVSPGAQPPCVITTLVIKLKRRIFIHPKSIFKWLE